MEIGKCEKCENEWTPGFCLSTANQNLPHPCAATRLNSGVEFISTLTHQQISTFRPIQAYQAPTAFARGRLSHRYSIPGVPLRSTPGYKNATASRLNPRQTHHTFSIEEREASTNPSIETKGCLNEAAGGVSSFCQVFFGYFL